MAPVKDSNTPLPRSYIEEYWTLVRKSLKNIFSKSPNEADALQQTIENLPIAQQDFFYFHPKRKKLSTKNSQHDTGNANESNFTRISR